MNFMKKILQNKDNGDETPRSGKRLSVADLVPAEVQRALSPSSRRRSEVILVKDQDQSKSSSLDLSVAHCNKLFLDIRDQNDYLIEHFGQHGPSKFDQAGVKIAQELEKKIYRLLPLFLKTFSPSGANDQFEQFEDLSLFTQIITKLMVSEIRKRASNKTTIEASQSIAEFLEISPITVTSPSGIPTGMSTSSSSGLLNQLHASSQNRGWVLLSTLNLLACHRSKTLVPIMASTSLPSTLVKCVYLFFDLPPLEDAVSLTSSNSISSGLSHSCSITKISAEMLSHPEDRRVLLHRVFTQLLVKLCAHSASLNELSRKDDLALLFTAITGCGAVMENRIWRATAAEVLLAMTKAQCLDLAYLHDRNCVIICVETISKLLQLENASPMELADICCTLITFFVELVTLLTNSDRVNESDQLYRQMVAVLLDDFQTAHGYSLLKDCVLRLEALDFEKTEVDKNKWKAQLHRLVSLLSSFTKCGTDELKTRPLSVNQLFIMDGFNMPRPSNKGSVKNLMAFNVLVNLWDSARSAELQELLLAALCSVYRMDRANYFTLDSQNTLCKFAQKLYIKPLHVQERFFEILEHVIFELRYVPCKELISVGNNLRANSSSECNALYLRSLSAISKFHPVFRDVYREVGLFDLVCQVFQECASNYIKSPTQVDPQFELSAEIMLHCLQGANTENGALFIQLNALDILYSLYTQHMLAKPMKKTCSQIIHQLVLSNCDEQHVLLLLNLIQACSPNTSLVNWPPLSGKKKVKDSVEPNKDELRELLTKNISQSTLTHKCKLRKRLLKTLIDLLRESHRFRALFRRVGGFACVIACLSELQNTLDITDKSNLKNNLNMLQKLFCVFMVAMRFEPANAKFFASEIGVAEFVNVLKTLGCFEKKCSIDEQYEELPELSEQVTQKWSNYFNDFVIRVDEKNFDNESSVCLIYRFLLELATDQLERKKYLRFILEEEKAFNFKSGEDQEDLKIAINPLVVHPVAILTALRLLAFISNSALQKYLINRIINWCMLTEHDQQVLSEAGLLEELLRIPLRFPLTVEHHPLHLLIRKIFIAVATQRTTCKEMRAFLRLLRPIDCNKCDDRPPNKGKQQGHIPHVLLLALNEVIKVEQQMNKRQHVRHLFKGAPSFVEFDLNQEGFGCIFLPSIAPVSISAGGAGNFLNQNLITNAILSANDSTQSLHQINGGIGIGERLFPPQGGLTFITWICIERLPAPPPPPNQATAQKSRTAIGLDDLTNVRLFTIMRTQKNGTQFACFQVILCMVDRSLCICTAESPLFGGVVGAGNNPEVEFVMRVPQLAGLRAGRWHQLVIVLSKALLKNSSCSVYVDGKQVATSRLPYISCVVGSAGSSGSTPAMSNVQHVNAYIGTPPQLRRQCPLRWKQGPCHLLEDPLSSQVIIGLCSLGPNYAGNLQGFSSSLNQLVNLISNKSPTFPVNSSNGQANLIGALANFTLSEDKVIFGLNARAASVMTLAKLRRVYSRLDCKQLAKLLALSIHENATPIIVLHNSAGHLNGPARSLGGILVGYVGCRLFQPKPASRTLAELGGCSLLLGAIAAAPTEEQLCAATRLLVNVFACGHGELQMEMHRLNGYQMLGVLFRKRRSLLSGHVFELICELSCEQVERSGTEKAPTLRAIRIKNSRAFKELLVDQLELWWAEEEDLLCRLLTLYIDLLCANESNEHRSENLRLLRQFGLTYRLLYVMRTQRLHDVHLLGQAKSVLFSLLQQTPQDADLLYFGQFIAALFPLSSSGELPCTEHIELRNYLLRVITQIITSSGSVQINCAMQEKLVRILGFDWFCLFFGRADLNEETIRTGLLNLLLLLNNPSLHIKFREGACQGGWLKSIPSFIYTSGEIREDAPNDVKLLGFSVSAFGGNLTNAIETNLNSLNNLTIENINESINSSLLERGDNAAATGLLLDSGEQFNLCGQKIEPLLFTIPGFQHLQWLLSEHLNNPYVYLLLLQCMLGDLQRPEVLAQITQLKEARLEQLEFYLNMNPSSQSSETANASPSKSTINTPSPFLAQDLACIFMSMIRKLSQTETHDSQTNQNALSLMNLFVRLYEGRRDFQQSCEQSSEFIVQLIRVLIHENDEQCIITDHPIQPIILRLMQLILVDGILCSGKPIARAQSALIRSCLTALSASSSAQSKILTAILQRLAYVMQQLATSPHFIACPPTQPQQSVNLSNVITCLALITDQLWAENLQPHDARELLQFLLSIFGQLQLETVLQTAGTGKLNISSDLPNLYRSTNRTLLYLLSRPLNNISDRMALLEILQRMLNNRKLVLSPLNQDGQFFACLVYCLLQFMDQEKIRLTKHRNQRNAWHVINANFYTSSSTPSPPPIRPASTSGDSGDSSRAESPSLDYADPPDEGTLLVCSCARKLCEELYAAKRTLLEESTRVNLNMQMPPFGVSSTSQELTKLKELLIEPTHKIWCAYLDIELQLKQEVSKSKSNAASNLDQSGSPLNHIANVSERLTQINRLSKVVGSGAGLMSKLVINTMNNTIKKDPFRLNSSASSSLDFPNSRPCTPMPTWTFFSKDEFRRLTSTHLQLLVDTMHLSWRTRWQRDLHVLKYVLHDWQGLEYEILTRARSIYGPECAGLGALTRLDKWQLDLTEGPNRMRKKLMRNELFYIHYPYRPEMDCPKQLKLLKCKQPISWDSLELHRRQQLSRAASIGEEEGLAIEDPLLQQAAKFGVINENSTGSTCNVKEESDITIQTTNESIDEGDEILDSSAEQSTAQLEQLECQSVLRLLEEGEKIGSVFRCARVLGLDTAEGLLLFGKEHFYLLDGFTILKSGEIRDIDSLPAGTVEPVVPSGGLASSSTAPPIAKTLMAKQSCMKFAYEEIREVHKRRYLLQPIALELFCLDGRNALLVFTRQQRNKLYTRFSTLAVNMNDNVAESLSGQRRHVSVESGGNILSTLISEPSVTQRWVRGEISNFQYLMHLNTLAGRSYNDLMQYPIFPWILKDYDSEYLDLRDSNVYRDLSKPMGAQSESRLEQFRIRYREFDCIQDSPPYHYGTFYSSAMIVASYLVRMEPFTQHFLRLQGGHFDLADRMFHSIRSAWLSASCHNMADVKELIPEFFYLPEFLVNSNRFDLGVKQNGVRLDHVQLPLWAKGDPKEFIRLHRAALESDYVSSHLHEWIDLIFGYKQQGQAAVDAVNVFHHLFYEGNVDIYTIDDPLRKNAIIGFINNFGQIPKQLFKRSHPVKKVLNAQGDRLAGNVFFGPNMQWPAPVNNSPPASASHLNAIQPTNSMPLSPLLSQVLGASVDSSSGPPSSTTPASTQLSEKLIMYSPQSLVQTTHLVKELRGCVGQIVQQDRALLAVEQNKMLIPPQFNKYAAWGFADQSIRIGNYESDRALAIFECDLLPCGGEVLCCAVPSSRILVTGGANSLVSAWRLKAKPSRLELLQHLYGHREAITCLASSAAYGLLVSGSRDRTCIVWDLNRLTFVRQLSFAEEPALKVLQFADMGDLTDEAKPYCSFHPAPISAICINELSGEIVTCCASFMFLWTINGELLACTNILHCLSQAVPLEPIPDTTSSGSLQILCACVSLYNEWELCNIIALGCSDGVARLFTVQFIQVASSNEPDTHSEPILETQKQQSEKPTEAISSDCENKIPINARQWNRRLVLQAELRPNVKDLHAISAISFAKDNRTLYLGDLRGRVFSFTVNV